MKKLLVVLLAFVMIFAFAACGSTEETDKAAETFADAIPVGDGVADIDISGSCFGTYEVVDMNYDDIAEDEAVVTYYDNNCDTPYIDVFSIPKNGLTLEEITKKRAETYGDGYYQMCDGFGYFTSVWVNDDDYYYCDIVVYEGDEQFHSVCYSAKTEELQIGDTDVYAWVPAGYTNIMTQDDIDHGSIFWGEYSEDYYFPKMWIGKWDSSYEYLNWYWANEFPDGVPYTEEEYADAVEEMESGSFDTAEYYKKMQTAIDFDSNTSELCKYDYNGEFYSLSGIWKGDDIWFQVGDDWYNACFSSELNPEPAYANAFLKSLHTK